MITFKSPDRPVPHLAEAPRPWVFLAGSIEMGKAEDWQTKLEYEMRFNEGTLFNPRRDDWDSTWVADHPELIRQINWELDFLERADLIVMYLDPTTKSPISLLELGLNGRTRSAAGMLVCCPDGFYRKTNVKVVCERYKIPLCHTFLELIRELKSTT